MKQLMTALALSLSATLAAAGVEIGKPLPAVAIPEKGEIILDNDKVSYAPWSTTAIPSGKPALVFHMPARMSSDSIIKPLKERLESVKPDQNKHTAVTIINLDDALWGTAGLVAGELEKNKKQHPQAMLIADDSSRGLQAWKMPKKTVTVMIVDTGGNVSYRHDGPMNEADIDEIVSKLQAQIASVELSQN